LIACTAISAVRTLASIAGARRCEIQTVWSPVRLGQHKVKNALWAENPQEFPESGMVIEDKFENVAQ
jgi:hypothetical protein